MYAVSDALLTSRWFAGGGDWKGDHTSSVARGGGAIGLRGNAGGYKGGLVGQSEALENSAVVCVPRMYLALHAYTLFRKRFFLHVHI